MNILVRGIRRVTQPAIYRFSTKTLMTKEEIEGNAELKKKVDSYAEDMEKLLK